MLLWCFFRFDWGFSSSIQSFSAIFFHFLFHYAWELFFTIQGHWWGFFDVIIKLHRDLRTIEADIVHCEILAGALIAFLLSTVDGSSVLHNLLKVQQSAPSLPSLFFDSTPSISLLLFLLRFLDSHRSPILQLLYVLFLEIIFQVSLSSNILAIDWPLWSHNNCFPHRFLREILFTIRLWSDTRLKCL